MTPQTTPPDLDLLPTDVEADLRASVRDLLADRCDDAAVAALADGDRSVVDRLWRPLAVDLGLAGLLVPEALGGAGGTAREAAAVLDELGRAVAPVPFLTSAVVATAALLGGEGTQAARGLLASLASGERTAALVVPWSTAPHASLPDLAGGGTVRSVAGAIEADVLLVLADGALRVVEAGAARIEPVVSLDMSRQVADVTVSAETWGTGGTGDSGDTVVTDGEAAVRHALTAGAALLASEQHGLAHWCVSATIGYLRERRQFGRVVGGYQALKHRLADLYVDTEQTGATAAYAAAVLAEGPGSDDLAVAAAVAQAHAGDVAVHAAEEALQLHGGIGMTWEHPVHLRLKRAKADQIALGTPGAHRVRLGELVDLTP